MSDSVWIYDHDGLEKGMIAFERMRSARKLQNI